MRRLLLLLSPVLTIAVAATGASATDGHFLHGVGAINAAMGGAGVAAPRSLLGTFNLNPAGLLAFSGSRMEFGFELFKPHRSVESDATAIGFGSGSTTSSSDFTPIPAMALSGRVSDRLALGIGALGIGGFGVDYQADPSNPILAPQPYGYGSVSSNYQFLKIAPAAAYAVTDRFWVGGAFNVDWASLSVQPMPVASPAVDPGPDGQMGTADDRAYYSSTPNSDGTFGWGFQVGALYKASEWFSVGASYTSPQWFSPFSYNSTWDDPNLPSYGSQRIITFDLDAPAIYAVGVAAEPSNRLVLAADVRYITYEQTAGFKEAGFNPDGSLKGFGWRNIWSGSFGAEWQVASRLALRGGYNVAGSAVRDSLAALNVAAPAVVKHHLTLGAGVRVLPAVEISAAYYHGFEGGIGGQMLTPLGPIPGTRVYSDLSEDSFLVQFSLLK